MNIIFYFNRSENNKIHKDILQMNTYDGILKDNTSFINPVIMLEQPINIIGGSNYMYIEDFGRYYFINDAISVSYNLTEVYGHVDVLMSFKDDLENNAGIIRSSESQWNLYLNDGSFKVYQYRTFETFQFPNSFPADNNLLLAVAGRSNIS